MQRIYKYEPDRCTSQAIHIKGLQKILSAKEQNDNIVLYALIEDDIKLITVVNIRIHGTGNPIINIKDYQFLDTVKLCNGSLMFHVFYNYFDGGG